MKDDAKVFGIAFINTSRTGGLNRCWIYTVSEWDRQKTRAHRAQRSHSFLNCKIMQPTFLTRGLETELQQRLCDCEDERCEMEKLYSLELKDHAIEWRDNNGLLWKARNDPWGTYYCKRMVSHCIHQISHVKSNRNAKLVIGVFFPLDV